MRDRLQRAPWWVLSLATGIPFGVLMGIFAVTFSGASPAAGLAAGAVAAVVYGALMGPVLAATRRFFEEDAPPSTPAQLRAAGRAASRGPVPDDPVVRALALHLARRRLTWTRRRRPWILPVTALPLAGCAYLAVERSPWWVAASLVFVGIAVLVWTEPTRMRRRLRELDRSAGTT